VSAGRWDAGNPLSTLPFSSPFALSHSFPGRNICHGSDSPEGAEHEIGFWFGPKELYNW
jgi:hypothetical protein